MNAPEECSNCKFWFQGNCRRLPPRVFAFSTNVETIVAVNPMTQYDWWCGEYQPKNDVVDLSKIDVKYEE